MKINFNRHYIPASFLANFSSELNLDKRRQSLIWVLRGKQNIYKQKVSNIACKKGIYGYGSGYDVDQFFSKIELQIEDAIKNLFIGESREISANNWIVIANFIATLFTRDPDFHKNWINDSNVLSEFINLDKREINRVLESKRLAGALLRAKWDILINPNNSFLTNDRGMFASINKSENRLGYVVPLGTNLAVNISKGPFKKQISWKDNKWVTNLPIFKLAGEEVDLFNQSVYLQSKNEVYGNNKQILEKLSLSIKSIERKSDEEVSELFKNAPFLGLSIEERMENENLILQLINGIRPPAESELESIIIV